jgi:hypothetical protein
VSGNVSAVQFHDQFHQSEPDTKAAESPAPLPAALVIQIKNPWKQIRRDPYPIISEFEND